MSDKIRKYVLPNLPYFFVFWFFSKIGTAYRIAPGADFGTKLMGMLDTFPKAFETYWPGLGGIDLLVGLAGAAGVYLLIQSKIKQAKKFRRDAEYGTARWGTKEDIFYFSHLNRCIVNNKCLVNAFAGLLVRQPVKRRQSARFCSIQQFLGLVVKRHNSQLLDS